MRPARDQLMARGIHVFSKYVKNAAVRCKMGIAKCSLSFFALANPACRRKAKESAAQIEHNIRETAGSFANQQILVDAKQSQYLPPPRRQLSGTEP
jgi:hypothetical protein